MISEKQLESWTGRGALVGSAGTYTSVKAALAAHKWPSEMRYNSYLQGSYANATNIRGDSDVDIVVEFNGIAYSNLNDLERRSLGISIASYGYDDCRREVIAALTSYYGSKLIDASGGKAIKILPQGGRLKADVLPCASYNRYEALRVVAEGVTFWDQKTRQQIINYPKLHIDNGAAKNGKHRTNERYKPAVRMFKNARNEIIGNSEELRKKYPSYFVECLFFNVPDVAFSGSWQDTYAKVVNHLNETLKNGAGASFTTQNQQSYLFGPESVQWSAPNAAAFAQQLAALWHR